VPELQVSAEVEVFKMDQMPRNANVGRKIRALPIALDTLRKSGLDNMIVLIAFVYVIVVAIPQTG
jgi:hypothetical protein